MENRDDGRVGSESWMEKIKKRREVTGENLIKDPKTGFLERKSGIGFNAKKKQRFLELFAEDKTVQEICKAVETPRNVVYSALAIDPEFRVKYLEIDEGHTDEIERVLRQNAKTNKMASAERIFYLKKKRPHIYGDKLIVSKASDDDLVKQLTAKLGDYQLIPKESIIEAKVEEIEEESGSNEAGNK